jgi:hypothetical protein
MCGKVRAVQETASRARILVMPRSRFTRANSGRQVAAFLVSRFRLSITLSDISFAFAPRVVSVTTSCVSAQHSHDAPGTYRRRPP